MKRSKEHSWKNVVARMLITCMVALSLVIITPNVADAASAPKLTKTSTNILEGKKYDLNVSNKISKSTYAWSTSNKKVATVDKNGLVKAVKKGTATITCKVKASKKTYTLTCKVSVVKAALAVKISNKTTALNVGQQYDLNRTIAPSTSNDKTYWTSSDKNIANPDKSGKFTALKAGTVTLTAKTLSGVKDTVKIKVVDKDGTVSTQADLDTLLKSAANSITIRTADATNFTIAAGDYSKKSLVVDAPKSDVTNNGTFGSVEIDQIKTNTWFENAKDNKLVVRADARIVVGSNATTSIEVNKDGASVKVEVTGTLKNLHIIKATKVEITGDKKDKVPVVADSATQITSSLPLNLTATAKITLTLLPGAEATTVQVDSEANIPTINGNVTITVTVGTGASAVTKTVIGTPIASSSAGGAIGGGGSSSGGSTFTFNTAISNIQAISITTMSDNTYSIETGLLTMVKTALTSDYAADLWSYIINQDVTVGAQTVNVKGTYGNYTKTVTISGDKVGTKTYTVTITNSSATIVSASNASVTLTKSTDDKTFSIKTSISVLDAAGSQTANTILDNIYSINVTYNNKAYELYVPFVDEIAIAYYEGVFLKANWTDIDGTLPVAIDGYDMNITGKAGNSTKTVTFVDGALNGQSYQVTVNSDGTVTVNNASGVSATISKTTDNISVTLY